MRQISKVWKLIIEVSVVSLDQKLSDREMASDRAKEIQSTGCIQALLRCVTGVECMGKPKMTLSAKLDEPKQ